MVRWTSSAGEFMGHPAITVPAPLQHHRLNVFGQWLIAVQHIPAQPVDIPGPAHVVQGTQATHRHRGMRDTRIRDHLVPFFKGYVASDFRKMVFSKASWPQ
ncbi:hypothetical protein [Deinococcus alpinitundrae]|uniref:hypothetical protein n=1 Tax=Deinococcus alpinitundrae TaxID=468913 RepID=UPI001ED90E01|nr:hypothetical protein [Deinococcus alpinitundrae]